MWPRRTTCRCARGGTYASRRDAAPVPERRVTCVESPGTRDQPDPPVWTRCATPSATGARTTPGTPRADVGLGMRRLSIIDVGGGRQPIGNEDGTVQVVFNGEIYNFHEIRGRLERWAPLSNGHGHRGAGPPLRGARDALVEELRGMFAFALWDGRRERLLIARDRLGIKPLYYSCSAAAGWLRIRAEVPGGGPGASSDRPRALPRTSHSGTCPTRSAFSRASQAAARPPRGMGAGARPHGTYWSPPAGRTPPSTTGRRPGDPASARGVGPLQAGGGRAARRLPLQRPGLEHGGGRDVAAVGPAGPDLLDRLRGAGFQRGARAAAIAPSSVQTTRS